MSNLDCFAPFVTRCHRKRYAPWVTDELKSLCKERDALYKRARRAHNLQLYETFKIMRRDIKAKMTLARQTYVRDQIASRSDATSIWKFLSKEGLTKERNSLATRHFTVHELNDYYSSVACAHSLCPTSRMEDIARSNECITNSVFEFSDISPLEVYNTAISLFCKSNGRSPDGLPLKYLETILAALVPILTTIYNHSLLTCLYPSTWKRAYIIPLNKCSTPSSPSETRPIANLPHLAKIFDKCIAKQMLEYFETNNLLSSQQFGFRSAHSTQTALLYLTDCIRNGIEQGMVTLVMSFDFRKAFDTISHEALLTSLKSLGFSANAIKWVHSYITGRQQAVIGEDNVMSNYRNVTSGVPQGSSPGPVLFLALINSLPNCLKFCKTTFCMFADDFQFFVQCYPAMLPYVISHINEDSDSVVKWAAQYGMDTNANKTTATLFGSTSNLTYVSENLVLPPIIVKGQVVKVCTQFKSLGVILCSDLSWNTYISTISSKVHYVLHKLRSRGWLLSRDTKQLLVQALVFPYVDYACAVYNHIPKYLDLKVQRLINAGIRFIFNLRRDASITPYRKELNWMLVSTRRKYFILCQMHGILTARKPVYFYEKFSELFVPLRRSARHQSTAISVPNSSTTAYKNSFIVVAAELWSQLPSSITNLVCTDSFRDKVLQYLLEHE